MPEGLKEKKLDTVFHQIILSSFYLEEGNWDAQILSLVPFVALVMIELRELLKPV
jgi:hypothetical protein